MMGPNFPWPPANGPVAPAVNTYLSLWPKVDWPMSEHWPMTFGARPKERGQRPVFGATQMSDVRVFGMWDLVVIYIGK
jgi:hypothetical protein